MEERERSDFFWGFIMGVLIAGLFRAIWWIAKQLVKLMRAGLRSIAESQNPARNFTILGGTLAVIAVVIAVAVGSSGPQRQRSVDGAAASTRETASASGTSEVPAAIGSTSTTEPPASTTSTTLSESASPSAAYLDEMEPIYGPGYRPGTGQAKSNGNTYLHALTMNTNYGDQFAIEYDLSRAWSNFSAAVGSEDSNRAIASAVYAVYLDGRKVATGDVRLGATTPIELDVNGVLRLRLEMTDVTGCCEHDTWVWGDPQVTR